MALILIEGFDQCTEAQAADKGYSFNSSFVAVGSSYGRFGGQGFQVNHELGTTTKNIGINKSTIYFGAAMRKDEVGTPAYTSGTPLLKFMDESATQQVRLHVTSGYELVAYQGDGTLLGTSAIGVIPNLQWFYFEVKITISATVGEVTARVNETQILNLTSKDTKNGTDYIRSFELNAINDNLDTNYDDMYIDDAAFHGDCRVQTFMSDSDGNSSDFTRSTGSNDYECVDESPSNEDTDYIESGTLNHKSIFGITTGTLGTVEGIKVSNHCKVTDAGVIKLKAICRSSSTDYQGTETDALSAEYLFKEEIWEDDPSDSNPWTQTKLEAAEFGAEITTVG